METAVSARADRLDAATEHVIQFVTFRFLKCTRTRRYARMPEYRSQHFGMELFYNNFFRRSKTWPAKLASGSDHNWL